MNGDTRHEVLQLVLADEAPCASLNILTKWLSLPRGITGDIAPLPTSPVRSTQEPVHEVGVVGVSDIAALN